MRVGRPAISANCSIYSTSNGVFRRAISSAIGSPTRYSIWRNANATAKAGLLDCFLNDSGSFRFADNLSEFGLSGRRAALGQRYGDTDGMECAWHGFRAGITARDRVDQSRVGPKHVCFATAQHFDGVRGEIGAQR
jgi:hypothetical protein